MHEKEFPIKPYVPSGATQVFKGSRFQVYTLKHEGHTREMINHPGAVVILPILDAEHIILIRNDRFAVGEALWELPAGTLEEGEHPSETASRELREETGYISQHITPLTSFYSSPGICNERMFTYYATDLLEGKQDLDETERISVVPFKWDDVMKMLKDGQLRDAKSIAALLYYRNFVMNNF